MQQHRWKAALVAAGARPRGGRRRVRRRRRGAGRRRRQLRRRADELRHDADRRRQGRRVLHHDGLRRAGEGRGARRQPRVPGPRQVRRRAADADRQRGHGGQARRDPDRADRHEGDVRADQAGGRRRHQDRVRRHHARAARHGGLADRVRQRGRRPRGGQTLAELVGGSGDVFVVNVKPGISTTDARAKGFEEGAKEARAELPRPGLLAGRAARGGVDHQGAARQEPRPQGRLRDEPVLRRGHGQRRARGGQAGRREDRRLRRRPGAGRAAREGRRAGADRAEAGRHRRPGRRAGGQGAQGRGDRRRRSAPSRSSITKDNLAENQDSLYKSSC